MTTLQIFLIYAAIVVFGASPLLLTIGAGLVAKRWGCVLHEGYENPCVRGGKDYGPLLYKLGVMGWAVLLTGPVAWLAATIFSVYLWS